MSSPSSDSDNSELPSSYLGTKEHWDETYARELRNYDSHGDEGEIWFGEDSLYRVLRWLEQNRQLVTLDTAHVLDLGCGNGFTCLKLAKEGYKNVAGVDYSQAAVDLSQKLAKQYNEEQLQYETCDILIPLDESSSSSSLLIPNKYQLCFDKGTYDAISLDPEDAKQKKEKYRRNVSLLLKEDGMLAITSCNWTEAELREQFQDLFEVKHVIPTPQFKFGGVVGNMVTSIIFKKKTDA